MTGDSKPNDALGQGGTGGSQESHGCGTGDCKSKAECTCSAMARFDVWADDSLEKLLGALSCEPAGSGKFGDPCEKTRDNSLDELKEEYGKAVEREPIDEPSEFNRSSQQRIVTNGQPSIPVPKTIEFNNVDRAPTSKKLDLASYNAPLTIIPRSTNPEAAKLGYLDNISKAVHSEARKRGSPANNAQQVLGASVAESTEASVLAEVAHAFVGYMLIMGGAIPQDVANVGYDVAVVSMDRSEAFFEQNPAHLPVYITPDMPRDAVQCWAASHPPGGFGARDWFYNDKAGKDLEPLASKYRYPIGNSAYVFVVAEGDHHIDNLVYSGNAITRASVTSLLRYYDNTLGLSGIFAQAVKTAAAIYWGYGPLNYSVDDSAGDGCRYAEIVRGRGGLTYTGPQVPSPVDDPGESSGVASGDVTETPAMRRTLLARLFELFGRRVIPRLNGEGDEEYTVRSGAATLLAEQCEVDETGITLNFRAGVANGVVVVPWGRIREILGMVEPPEQPPPGDDEEEEEVPPPGWLEDQQAFRTWNKALRTLLAVWRRRLNPDDPFPDGPDPEDDLAEIDAAGFRNVFGQRLHAECIPSFPSANRDGFLGLMAKISVLPDSVRKKRVNQTAYLSQRFMQTTRRYAARLHFLACHARYRNGWSSDVMDSYSTDGTRLSLQLPQKFRPALVPGNLDKATLPGPGVECQEHGLVMYDTCSEKVPYASFCVEGNWEARDGSTVKVACLTSKALGAMDAAVRFTLHENGRINMVKRMPDQVTFIRIRTGTAAASLFAPFSVPRHFQHPATGLSDVEITSDRPYLAAGTTAYLYKQKSI